MKINGAVRCECGEYAVDMVRTVDGWKGFCADHLAKCQAKVFEDIVRELAADHPVARYQDSFCNYCGCDATWRDQPLEMHKETCLWRRAAEATR